MPEQGEQHKAATASANPFEEVKSHINEYTAQDIATLSSRLEKQLGPEYISSRPGAGGAKVHYLSADKCINLANEVFGFNGWSSSIQNIQIDFVDESQSTGKVSLGLSVIVRVMLRDGTYHEDVGYGHIENCKGKAAAFEKAKKEGTTDGLKRALRNFGNLLGNCVYDKEYVAKVTKLKVTPNKWDPDNLHRHPDFAPVKKEPVTGGVDRHPSLPRLKQELASGTEDAHSTTLTTNGEDEFGSDDFDEVDFSVPQGDHPDEISVDSTTSSELLRRRNSLPVKQCPPQTRPANLSYMQRPRSPSARMEPQAFPQTPLNAGLSNFRSHCPISEPNGDRPAVAGPSDLLVLAQQPKASGTAHQPLPPGVVQNARPAIAHSIESSSSEQLNESEHGPPVGFFTARAAESLQSGLGLPVKASAFDPHLESPSIRKTAGVDHTKTKPIGRETLGNVTTSSAAAARASSGNPQVDKTRRLGMPGGGAIPLQNRGSYKPPSMKRPAEMHEARSALGDVTAASVNGASDDGDIVKRLRINMEA